MTRKQELDVLSSLCKRGVDLWVDGGQLRYRCAQGVLSPQELAALRQQKEAIVAALSRPQAFTETPLLKPLRSSSDLVPLTAQQHCVWNILRRYDSAKCLVTYALHLRGVLDSDALRKSLVVVVQRHESLRTRIVVIDGTPWQAFACPGEYDLQGVVVSGLSKSDIDGEAQRRIGAFFSQGLGIASGPLFDARLLRLAEHEHVLAIAIHHIIIDAASVALFFRELWACYKDFAHGREASFPRVAAQYADYAIWQQQTHCQWLQDHSGYWREKIAGAARVHLPVDSGLENVTPGLAEMQISFGPALSSALYDLARQERVMPAMIVLALYVELLSCWCNERDFLVPFGVTGRRGSEDVSTIGYFSHILLLRIELTGNESFVDLLHLVTREFFASYGHLDFGKTIGELPDPLRGAPLQWLARPPGGIAEMCGSAEWDHLEHDFNIEPFPLQSRPVEPFLLQTDVVLNFWNTAQGVCGAGLYRTDLFTEDTMQRFLRDLRLISEHAARERTARAS